MKTQAEKKTITTVRLNAVVLGVFIGQWTPVTSGDDAQSPAKSTRAVPAPRPDTHGAAQGSEVVRVKLGDLSHSAAIGAEDALVTVVAFIDYQCPFCARAHDTLEEVSDTYGDKVRVVFKHNPLSYHPDAALAAQAALAAMDLDPGKFSAIHRLLLRNQDTLKLENLLEYGTAAGLNPEVFESALNSGAFAEYVKEDAALARKIGVSATPYFFVNGRPLRGAKPFASFKTIIDEEINGSAQPTRWVEHLETRRRSKNLPTAKKMSRSAPDGVPAQLRGSTDRLILQQFAEMQKELRKLKVEVVLLRKTVADLERAARHEPGRLAPVPTVNLDDDPALGNSDAKVGIVVFSDYGSAHARNLALETLPLLKNKYIDTGRVRFVFRDYPLRHNPQAKGAAIAANCAGKQNAYWRMHDALFAHTGSLGPAVYEDLSKQLGLDTQAFLSCMRDTAESEEIEKDLAYANSIGVRNAPILFVGRVKAGQLVDARRLRGAQDFESLSTVIESFLN